jgi:L-asparaginase type II
MTGKNNAARGGSWGIRALFAGILAVIILVGMPAIPAAAAAELPAAPLPHIHILATGGTIAGTAQDAGDLLRYEPGTLGVATLIASVPELRQYANVTGEQVCNINSDDMTPAIWLNLSRKVNALSDSPDVDGIVVTHGTDTLEETAYFLNLVTSSGKPVVVTGAMRPATAISADGPLNLLNAVQLAASPVAGGNGVLIAMNGEILGARDTTKTSTRQADAFRSPDFGRMGYMDDGNAVIYRVPVRKHTAATGFNVTGLSALPRVDIVAVYPGMDTAAIEACIRQDTRGLVVDAMGNGEYPKAIEPALRAAAMKGIPIVIASQTGSGITSARDPLFIPADTLTARKARILLMLALTQTHERDRIAEMFRTF